MVTGKIVLFRVALLILIRFHCHFRQFFRSRGFECQHLQFRHNILGTCIPRDLQAWHSRTVRSQVIGFMRAAFPLYYAFVDPSATTDTQTRSAAYPFPDPAAAAAAWHIFYKLYLSLSSLYHQASSADLRTSGCCTTQCYSHTYL